MREIRQSGSEGGVVGNGHPYPYQTGRPTTSPCRPGPPTRRSPHFPYGPTCADAQ